jgi:hypothetical protein
MFESERHNSHPDEDIEPVSEKYHHPEVVKQSESDDGGETSSLSPTTISRRFL